MSGYINLVTAGMPLELKEALFLLEFNKSEHYSKDDLKLMHNLGKAGLNAFKHRLDELREFTTTAEIENMYQKTIEGLKNGNYD